MRTLVKKTKIEKKLHPFHEKAFMKATSRLILQAPEESKNNKITVKYAPKYSRSLLLESWRDRSLMNALKRIKKIDYVDEGDSFCPSGNQWRLILQNKFKSIQRYNNQDSFGKKQEIQKYKAFLNVRELLLDLAYESTYNWREREKQELISRHLLHYLPSMKNIKHFDIEIYRKTDPVMLEMLNSMPNFLSSLKSLSVLCATDRKLKILPALVNCKNILEHTTHLSIVPVADVEPDGIYESLFEQCKNLISLSINLTYKSISDFNVHPQCLKTIQNLDRLEVIRVSFDDIFSFLEDFVAPPCLKQIILDSKGGSWNKAYQKFLSVDLNTLSLEKTKDVFENDQRLARISEKWKNNMKNLISLSLLAHQDLEQGSALPIFAKTLIKNLENLETFNLYFSSYYPGEYKPTHDDYNFQIISIDLRDIFETLQDACRKLATLKLSFSKDHYISCSEIRKDFTFPQFIDIDLSESAIENFEKTMRNLFDAIKRSAGKSVKLSICETVYRNSELLDLLKVLHKPPRNCEIDMKIIEFLGANSFDEDLDPFIQKARNGPVVKNVSLTVLLDGIENLQRLSFLCEIFENVQFQTRETSENRKIANKFHPFREDTLIKASRRSLFLQPPDEFKNKVIRKYAPKYSSSLVLNSWKDHKLANALKRIKKIDLVSDGWALYPGNQWRLILQNKFKSIQIYRQYRDSKESTEKYKMFSNTKKILVRDSEKPSDRLQSIKLLKFLPKMKNVKSLEIERNFDFDPMVLTELNSMTSFLSSLETLTVNFGTGLILPAFVQCQNILRSITSLSYCTVAKNEALKVLDSLSKYCENLVYMNTDFSYRSFSGFETDAGKCLKIFKNFEKLETLHISFDDIFFFLEYFAPPPSLKRLEIDSMRSPWKKVYEKFFSERIEKSSNLGDLLENDKRLKKWVEKPDGLKNLISLRFVAYEEAGETPYILPFVRFFLKNFHGLESFELEFDYCGTKEEIVYNEYDDYENVEPERVSVDLVDVLEALKDGCGKLETLKISFSRYHTISCSAIPVDFVFPRFTEMKFAEDSIYELETIRNLFNANEKELIKNMKFLMFYTLNDNESLLGLLQILQKSPKNYQVDMVLVVKG